MATKKSAVKFNIDKLEVLASSMKKLDDGKYKIQVGIFGDKNARPEDKAAGPTNAEIGYKMEMGVVSERIPRRSFLWDTFTKHFAELETTVKDAKLVEKYLQAGKLDLYLGKVGSACENLVKKAFWSSGWGDWPALSAMTLRAREERGGAVGGERPLLDTGQLWQSISSRAVKS